MFPAEALTKLLEPADASCGSLSIDLIGQRSKNAVYSKSIRRSIGAVLLRAST